MSNVGLFLLGELAIVVGMFAVIVRLRGQDAESRQLYFGSVVLTSMALIFALSMVMYYWADGKDAADRSLKIFESCVNIIPPLLTLVIGFYFGKQSERPAKTD